MFLEKALAFHARTIERMQSAASAVPPERWRISQREGKWSPAEVLEHVTSVYLVLEGELTHGRPMRVVTERWQRAVLRTLVMPVILVAGHFPAGARAPKELRPPAGSADATEGVARFRAAAEKFESRVREAETRRPRAFVTHPYFGRASLLQAVLFCARHTEHHRRQLLPSARPEGTSSASRG